LFFSVGNQATCLKDVFRSSVAAAEKFRCREIFFVEVMSEPFWLYGVLMRAGTL